MPMRIDPSLQEDGTYSLALTAGKPLRLKTKPGQGSLSLGPREKMPKADLYVAADATIQWSCFEPFATPAGSPWPRSFYYSGNDSGFFTWAQQRPIESFSWYPQLQHDVQVDASQSQIRELSLYLQPGNHGHISLKLPQQGMRLHLHGDLAQVTISSGLPDSLSLSPATGKNPTDEALQLPDMGSLQQISRLELCNGAGKQAISLQGLLQFSELESLALWGNHSHLALIARCSKLKALSLRFMPELAELPALQTWPELDFFIAYNVEEAAGKRLRQQLKDRAKLRPWADYTSVSQLRKPQWWAREYGRPFASWPASRAKVAHAAYDLAEQHIGAAKNLAEIQAALTAFTLRFNTVKGIETSEREDLAQAVQQLAQSPHAQSLGMSDALTQQWFDDSRDY